MSTVLPVQVSGALKPLINVNHEVPALPSCFPPTLEGELAWNGADFVSESTFIYELTGADKNEIRAGLAHFKGLELDGGELGPASFPLPTLAAKFRGLSRDVYDGKGFCVVRGIDPNVYAVEDLTLVYLGIQSHIADQRGRQDKRGNMLVHIVADNSSKERDEHHRHSTKSISFHNEESGDIVSWLTRSTAAAGGKCIIASCYTVYNVLAARRPDLIRVLARSDWPFALPRFKCRPVIFYEDSRFIMNFGRAALLGSAIHPRPARLPCLTSRQIEALDAIETIAQATQLEFQTQAGDMHFINNLAVLHRREGFADGKSATEKRHLVRMRLRDSQRGWKIPQSLKGEWHAAFEEQDAAKVWHLEPMPDAFFPLRKYPN
ncbi:Clavaminate synthase-like protein [Coniochaeta ligniaria NRRL 30616]|uniref:Clavaminate synthase-like protein n=1 Tax=Coniochaeta ligniaria NRRL 30616 TaxID=1408157 RepID=A0A1J7J6H6_9PEZI|nr:Clavaminate synthase-like protein [Coniochaeta ligniaria NRRL 30616]